jgi:hypothetical protein
MMSKPDRASIHVKRIFPALDRKEAIGFKPIRFRGAGEKSGFAGAGFFLRSKRNQTSVKEGAL